MFYNKLYDLKGVAVIYNFSVPGFDELSFALNVKPNLSIADLTIASASSDSGLTPAIEAETSETKLRNCICKSTGN